MKIFIATGASGGHIYPALTVSDDLRAKGHTVIFVGVFRHWQDIIRREGFDFVDLPIKDWGIKSLKCALVSFFYVLQSLRCVSRLIMQHRPDRIIGFGGYGSFPVVLGGWFKGVPVFIHEQNVVAGQANRYLGWVVRRVMISFPDTKRYFSPKKVTHTGYPLRKFSPGFTREGCLKEFGFFPEALTIAVCGGSQGSRTLNQVMVQASRLLKEKAPIQILHLAGTHDCEIVERGYGQAGVRHRVFPFFHEMEKIYLAADIIVARAGAGLLHEIAFFGIPAVIVPYPYAGTHQKKNAMAFLKNADGLMIEEKYLTAERLCGEIMNFSRAGRDIKPVQKNVLLKTDAVQSIVRIVTGDVT